MSEKHVLSIVNSWDEYVATFTSGKTAGVINGCWILASVQTAEDLSGKWALTDMPSLPGVDSATNYSNQGGSTWAITSNCKNTELAEDFLATTFAGSTELYDTILPSSGAIAPGFRQVKVMFTMSHRNSLADRLFNAKISEFAEKTPSVDLGVYYTEANTAIATAVANISGGADIDSELKTAQETVEFNMNQ